MFLLLLGYLQMILTLMTLYLALPTYLHPTNVPESVPAHTLLIDVELFSLLPNTLRIPLSLPGLTF